MTHAVGRTGVSGYSGSLVTQKAITDLIKKVQSNPISKAISNQNQAKFGFFIPPSPGQGIFGTPVINPTPEIINTSGTDLIKLRDQILVSNTVGPFGGLATIPSATGQQAGVFFSPTISFPNATQPTNQSNPQGSGKPFFESLKEGFKQIPKEVLLGAGILGIFLLLRK